VNFWDYFDKDIAVWKNHKLAKKNKIRKRPWSPAEVIKIHETLKEQNHWLAHTVWIAAHTGARLGAICDLSYDPEQKTIRFPAQKKEENDRIIPAHPEITKSLDYWLNNRKSKSSVSGKFTAFKSALGYGPETDFHSFRRTFITELENIECPEAITADIVGHKKQTITYGIYSSGSKIELMRKWLDKVGYKSFNVSLCSTI
jgi:integrase